MVVSNMSKAYDLYQKYSMEELLQMQKKIEDEHRYTDQQMKELNTFWLYPPDIITVLDDYTWAIEYHRRDKKYDRRSLNPSRN